jgi:hypothetical protein
MDPNHCFTTVDLILATLFSSDLRKRKQSPSAGLISVMRPWSSGSGRPAQILFAPEGAKWGGKMMARVMTKPGKEGRPMILPIGFMGFSFF